MELTNLTKTEKPASPSPANIQGPAWDNSTEYASMAAPLFEGDLATVETNIGVLKQMTSDVRSTLEGIVASPADSTHFATTASKLQTIAKLEEDTWILLANLSTFVSCELGVDGSNQTAQKLTGRIQQMAASLSQSVTAVSLFLARAPEAVVEMYLNHESTRDRRFTVSLSRKYRDTLLNESEENLLSGLATHGHTSWGNLYNSISSQMKCRLKFEDGSEKTMGFAQASGLVKGDDEPTRKAAWNAISESWRGQKESAAAILNSLAGWRIEVAARRSSKIPQTFMSMPLRVSKIEQETLDAMMTAVREYLPTSREGLRYMAKGMGKSQLAPWDTLAGAPSHVGSGNRTFQEGFDLIRAAFMAVDPEFGEFCDLMLKNKWIEGRVLETKRNGAYCTGFAKSRTPRVFQSYMGSLNDIRTLAHELGHAYHSWVQRDLPRAASGSPMTLAETASVFAETAFADYMAKHGDTRAKDEVRWQNAETAGSFLINIPVRYEFEKAFYTQRQKSTVTADELSGLMSKAWMDWYGDTVTGPDEMFWASKLHFAMSQVSFYNFPYTFGYLFSLSIYAKRQELGPSFMPAYRAILRDTGRMTAEDLVMTHLKENIRDVAYWKKALQYVPRV